MDSGGPVFWNIIYQPTTSTNEQQVHIRHFILPKLKKLILSTIEDTPRNLVAYVASIVLKITLSMHRQTFSFVYLA